MRHRLLLPFALLLTFAICPVIAAQPQFVIIANVSTYPLAVKSFSIDGKPCAACVKTIAPQSSSALIPAGSSSAKLKIVTSRPGGVEMALKSDAHETEVTYANNASDDKIKLASKTGIKSDFMSADNPAAPTFMLIYVYDKPKD
ncbi:MAG TPA: hypothetical protein VN043_16515 [Rhodanobacter sp.]|nr:hypothetical protein [Rhodanobacter sp.]